MRIALATTKILSFKLVFLHTLSKTNPITNLEVLAHFNGLQGKYFTAVMFREIVEG